MVVGCTLFLQGWVENMLTALQNKSKLKYALLIGTRPEYKTDDDGNVIYVTIKGKQVPQETGEEIPMYSEPIDFLGNIAFSSGEAEAETFGIAVGDYDSKLLMLKGEIPIDETSIIFKDSEPVYQNGFLVKESSDFIVKKVAPSLNHINYLLKRITK